MPEPDHVSRDEGKRLLNALITHFWNAEAGIGDPGMTPPRVTAVSVPEEGAQKALQKHEENGGGPPTSPKP